MKVVILAGGLGTRIAEETSLKPKPMIEVGGRPILWHILKIYSSRGINDFIICAGYKGYVIKEYFANYFLHMSDVTFNVVENSMEVHKKRSEPWKVTIVDTGENTMTGGRLKRVKDYIGNETFCFTYGDGVSNINKSYCQESFSCSICYLLHNPVYFPGVFRASFLWLGILLCNLPFLSVGTGNNAG
mgnify:CR=1 FL=1